MSSRENRGTGIITQIAMALANRYATIYYVDLRTDHYIEYSASNEYRDLEVPPEGTDFFNESRKNILRVIHPEDQDRLLRAFDKNNILALTENGRKFRIDYRLMLEGEAHHVRLTAVQTEDAGHLIITLDSIDEEMKNQEALKEKNVVFSQIAESLAARYGMIYYVNTETDEYLEFTAADEYRELNISPAGSDFFGTSQRNVGMIIHPADRERVFEALDKRTMLKALEEKGSFSMTYQLMLAEGSSYTRMTVFWANDHRHIIMGVMNIDQEIRQENAMKKMAQENAIFSQIAESLANQYDTIYYVDMLTNHYTEFASTDVYKSLDVRPSGEDFFSESLANIERVVYPEDREGFQRIMTKTTLMQMLQGKHMITHTYRLLMPAGPQYARLSIIWANDNKHLIVGVMNVDQEVRREQQVQQQLLAASAKAYRDELTGVKNKAAYQETADALQSQVTEGTARPFAILVCDVNGLKQINDQLGHIEGDKYICDACRLICHTWEHSPVFRVGGDEFVVLLQGADYERRETLLSGFRQKVLENQEEGGVIVATGMAEFQPGADHTVPAVFERADRQMYENKAALKMKRESNLSTTQKR